MPASDSPFRHVDEALLRSLFEMLLVDAVRLAPEMNFFPAVVVLSLDFLVKRASKRVRDGKGGKQTNDENHHWVGPGAKRRRGQIIFGKRVDADTKLGAAEKCRQVRRVVQDGTSDCTP